MNDVVTYTLDGDIAVLSRSYQNDPVRHDAGLADDEAIDAEGWLHRKRDSGFLWWDWVHLTSYGQRLLGEAIDTGINSLVYSNDRIRRHMFQFAHKANTLLLIYQEASQGFSDLRLLR